MRDFQEAFLKGSQGGLDSFPEKKKRAIILRSSSRKRLEFLRLCFLGFASCGEMLILHLVFIFVFV